jgi:hypothetical protein
MFPHYWTSFLKNHELLGKSASLSEEDDMSEVSADIIFLTEAESNDELENFWPGIGVAKDGFVPIGACAIGSGDYYYINLNDGTNGPMYRIYHDAVHSDGYDPATALDKVLDHYESIRFHIRPYNYAIKATSVERLDSSFASGASAPYFGC